MPPHAPPPASLAEVACSGKQTARHLADRACARARAASTAGFCSAPFLGLRNPRLTKSCSRHLAAPPHPPPQPSHLFPFYTLSTPTLPLSQRVPGRSSRNRTISTPTFSTRDAQPCLQVFLKQRLLVALGAVRGGQGRGRESGGTPRGQSHGSGPRPCSGPCPRAAAGD